MLSFNILFIWSNSLIGSDESNSRSDFVIKILRNIKNAIEDVIEGNEKKDISANNVTDNKSSTPTNNTTSETTAKENSTNTGNKNNTAAEKDNNTEKKKTSLINSRNLSTIVRKSAHFAEYMVLGIVLSIMNINLGKPKLITILLICQSVAVIDEFIQSFSGRSDKVSDIIIDICGAVTGIVIVFIIYKILKHRKENKLKIEK